MKQVSWFLAVLTLFGTAVAGAAQTTPAASESEATAVTATALSDAELETLVAPIALYPDVLLAQVLPAATFPTDVVMAARWLRTSPDMQTVVDKPWDVSVKSLCHYPDVIYKLDEDLEWTNALGAAFLGQPDAVMKAIQAGRSRAQERNLLATTPQQTVVVEGETIRIVPTEATTVYVPQYDPAVIYIDDDDDDYDDVWVGASLGFGAGFALGAWLNMDCDWHGYAVHYCRPGYWGGWGHYGRVAWGDDWVAGVGPRGGFIAGEDRGVAVGRRGGAAWGPNGGAVWRRPPVATPLPSYTGRYAGYNRSGNMNYVSRDVSNTLNRNVNNINIDRGDRTSVSGDWRNLTGGNRYTDTSGERLGSRGERASQLPGRTGTVGDQSPARTGDRAATPPPIPAGDRAARDRAVSPGGERAVRDRATPAGGDRAVRARPVPTGGGLGSQRPSAFGDAPRAAPARDYSQRGQQSRDVGRSTVSPPRSSSPPPRAQPSRPAPSSRSGAFSSGGGSRSGSYGSRGASSRGGGGRSGGGRGGGGRGGRR